MNEHLGENNEDHDGEPRLASAFNRSDKPFWKLQTLSAKTMLFGNMLYTNTKPKADLLAISSLFTGKISTRGRAVLRRSRADLQKPTPTRNH